MWTSVRRLREWDPQLQHSPRSPPTTDQYWRRRRAKSCRTSGYRPSKRETESLSRERTGYSLDPYRRQEVPVVFLFPFFYFLEAPVIMKSWILFMNLFSRYTFFFSYILTFSSVVLFLTAHSNLVLLIHLFCLSPLFFSFIFFPTLCYFFLLWPSIPYHRTTTKNHLPSFTPFFSPPLPLEKND